MLCAGMTRTEILPPAGRFPSRFARGLALLLVMLVAPLAPGAADAAGLVEGLRKYEAGDYAGAILEWRQLADQENPDALFNLAQVYRLGRGVAVDSIVAVEYYRRAADAGHAGARGALATIYYFDHGTRQKRGQAIALWRQAAAAGDAPSQYTLAILHFNGQDVPEDLVQAYAWALLAAGGGLAEGQKAERSIRSRLTPNQLAQARVLKRGLLVSVPQAPAMVPAIVEEVAAAELVAEVASEAVEAIPEPAPEPALEPVSPPSGETAVAAGVAEAPVGGWSVQLGFYRSSANAGQDLEKIAPRLEALMPGVYSGVAVIDYGPERGIFHQLLAGSFAGRAEAISFCGRLKQIGIDCVAVRR